MSSASNVSSGTAHQLRDALSAHLFDRRTPDSLTFGRSQWVHDSHLSVSLAVLRQGQ